MRTRRGSADGERDIRLMGKVMLACARSCSVIRPLLSFALPLTKSWGCVGCAPLPAWNSAWARVVRVGMKRLGFLPAPGQWTWTSGPLRVALGPQRALVPVDNATAHVLREGWRRMLFRSWLCKAHRDSRLCRDATYSESTCKDVRQAALADRNHFTILCGAAFSRAKRHLHDDGDVSCPWCSAALGHWDHLCWDCPGNPPPLPRPRTVLASRLGWGNSKALAHLCATRLRLLKPSSSPGIAEGFGGLSGFSCP